MTTENSGDVTLLDDLCQLRSSEDWLRFGKDAVGLYYDLDAAILKVFRIDDREFKIRMDDGGRILARIAFPRPVRSLEALNVQFFRLWSRVTMELSVTRRAVGLSEVTFEFLTGTPKFAYAGRVVFYGESIERMLARHREIVSSDPDVA